MQCSTTPLERRTRDLYYWLHIFEPSEINMFDIADKLNVWLHFVNRESRVAGRNGMYSIIINHNQSAQEQWEDFGHEVAHLLESTGNQLNLPPELRKTTGNPSRKFCSAFLHSNIHAFEIRPYSYRTFLSALYLQNI